MRRPGRSRLPRLSTMVEQGGALECLPGDVWIEFLRTSERKVGQGDDANDRVRLITNRKVMYMPVPHCAQGILDAVILSAVDDTPSHDLTDRRGRRVQTLGGRPCRKILLGQDADENVAFTNREAADIAVSHPSCGVSKCGAWRCPFDTSAHQLSDDHGVTPGELRSKWDQLGGRYRT
jgi:hypothetical protein